MHPNFGALKQHIQVKATKAIDDATQLMQKLERDCVNVEQGVVDLQNEHNNLQKNGLKNLERHEELFRIAQAREEPLKIELEEISGKHDESVVKTRIQESRAKKLVTEIKTLESRLEISRELRTKLQQTYESLLLDIEGKRKSRATEIRELKADLSDQFARFEEVSSGM